MIIRDTYIVREDSRWVRLHRAEFRAHLSYPKMVSRFFLEEFVGREYAGLEEITLEYANELISKTRNV